MKKYIIIDRFEGDYAVCERDDKSLINIERHNLPPDAKEGDYLIENEDGSYYVDIEATENRKQQIRRKLDSLFE